MHGIIGLQGLWKRQGQIILLENRAEESGLRTNESVCFVERSLSRFRFCLFNEEENDSCVQRQGPACHNLLGDEPFGAHNRSTECSVLVHYLADYCETLQEQ